MDSNGSGVLIALFVIAVLIAVYFYIHHGKDDGFKPEEKKVENFRQSPNFPNPTGTNATVNAVGEILNHPVNPDNEWMELVKKMELDPSVVENHAEFVRDATRFSSGANFTSVADDNTNFAFVNFQGLRRPSHVNVGASARQVPDIDETVLQRQKPFRFN